MYIVKEKLAVVRKQFSLVILAKLAVASILHIFYSKIFSVHRSECLWAQLWLLSVIKRMFINVINQQSNCLIIHNVFLVIKYWYRTL